MNLVKRVGFTLIELLVVIAIIAILAALVTPAISSALKRAKSTQSQAEAKSIESAIRAYYNEYAKLPLADADQGQNDKEFRDSKAIISRLTTNNPRRIVFIEAPGGLTDGTFKDPWGTQYAVALDSDYSGQIAVSGSGMGTNLVLAPGVAYSAGPDLSFVGTVGGKDSLLDNVFSFK